MPDQNKFTEIIIRYTFIGFHRWPDAPAHRQYLSDTHRHLFYVEASVQVFEHDREIEFHDFMDYCKGWTENVSLGSYSCEMIADNLAKKITRDYPNRRVSVSVFEDNEVGAKVTLQPQ